MKKSKFILLSLISLSLVGCGNVTSSTTTSSAAPSSEAPIGTSSVEESTTVANSSVTETSSSAKESSAEESSVEASSAGESSAEETSSVEDSTSVEDSSTSEDSSSSFDPYSVGWSKSITDTMVKYLNGQVIPLVSVGKYSECYVITSSYTDVYHLEIEGTNVLDATLLSNANTNFVNAGWTIGTNSTTKLTATLESDKGDLSVEIGKDDSDFVVVKIFFDEPYDPTIATAWDTDVTQDFTDYLAGIVPTYVYLGTANPISEYDTYNKKLVISGGKWVDTCVADIKTQLGADWTVADETTTGFTATYTNAADNTVVTMVLSKKSKGYSSSLYLITATYSVKEAFNPSSFTAWPQSVQDVFDDTFEPGLNIPAIYLGTKSPTASASYSGTYVTVEGADWDDQMMQAAKDKLDADNATHNDATTGLPVFTAPETAWTYEEVTDSYGDTTLEMEKTLATGGVLKLELEDYYGDARLTVRYEAPFEIPSTYTSWPQDILDGFNTYLDGHVLPLLYLNTDSPSSYKYSSYWAIEGASWSDSAFSAVKQAFTNANVAEDQLAEGETNWVYSLDNSGYYPYATWTKTYADGCIVKVQLEDQTGNSYLYDMDLRCYLIEGFNPDSVTNKAWTQAILDDFATYFGANTIPYFYTGTKVPTGSWYSYSEYYEITGGNWDDQILTLAQAAFNADTTLTWSFSTGSNSYGATLTATSSATADNKAFKVIIGQNYYEKCIVDIYLTSSYDKAAYDAAGGTWLPATNTALATMFHGHTLPNFYLATDAETTSNYSSYIEVDITGGAWDDQVVTDCKSYLDADVGDDWADATKAAADTSTATWEYTQDIYSSYPRLLAWKKLSDGGFLRFKLFNSSDKIKVYSWYDAPVVAPTATAWTADQETTLNDKLGTSAIPFFGLYGDVTVSATSGTANSVTIKSVNNSNFVHSNAESLNIYDTFIAAGYTSDDFQRFYSDAGTSWSVTKMEGSIKLNAKYTPSTYSPYVTITASSAYTPAQPGEDWTDTVKNTLTNTLGFTIPYVNIGTVTTNTYTNNVTLKGSTWDDQMLVDARTAFEADGWDCCYDYTYNGKTLVGSKEVTTASNETKHLSVKFYDYGYNSSYNPHVAYFDIYLR